MAHTVIGTAGHIDHGKTLLVKALTGMDTDRTPQEKERGITIELGFAFLGEEATIIDVPGHERFVKTMVAGVSTVDLALLVIAADDGIMPQSREHLDVLELMGVRRGLVVLNKIDLVEGEGEEWLEMLEEEIRELTRGTFLEGAEIFRVSALTGEGIDPLRRRLEEMIAETSQRRSDGLFRLPVDRAFLIKGFGLVCTGTVIGGRLRVGDDVELHPGGRVARVRGLQRHGQAVEQVQAGDRAAVNLTGVEVGQVERGDLMAAPGYFRPAHMLDVRLRLLSSAPRPLEQRTRVRLHLGTREILARVVLLDRDLLDPGASALAQLRLEAPVVAAWGDRFVIRRYSPPLTIGGGQVLDPHPVRHRRSEQGLPERLARLESARMEQVVGALVRQARDRMVTARELAGKTGLGPDRIDRILHLLEEEGEIEPVRSGGEAAALHLEVRKELEKRIETALEKFHAEHPLRPGLRRGELRNLSVRHAQPELFDHLLAGLEEKGRIRTKGSVVSASGYGIRLSAEEEALKSEIEKAIRPSRLTSIPDVETLARRLGVERRRVEELIGAMQSLGLLRILEGGLLIHAETVEEVRRRLRTHLEAEGGITVSRFRELIGGNRKYALALLGLFDREGFTERRGDLRVLRQD